MKKRTVTVLSVLLALILCASLLTGCSARKSEPDAAAAPSAKISSVDDLAGRRVGTLKGSALMEKTIAQVLPSSEPVYYNTVNEILDALLSGAVDAIVTDEAVIRSKNLPELCAIMELGSSDCAFFFPKTEDGASLCAAFDEYLAAAKADGTVHQLEQLWFGTDETVKTVDLSNLTGENGTLRFAISTDVGEPCVYKKDGSYVGYDIDMAKRFCAERGYALEITDYRFEDLLDAVASGKADLGASCVTVTEERKESLLFSDINFSDGILLVVRAADTDIISVDYMTTAENADPLQQFSDKTIGIETGTVHSDTISVALPESKIKFYNSIDDIATALQNGEIDAYADDEPTVRMYIDQYEGHYVAAKVKDCDYAYAFPKNSEKSALLMAQMNDFLAELKRSGDLAKIDQIWFGDNENKKVVHYDALTGENGTLTFAVSSGTAGAFVYQRDGEYVGYDVDIAVRFCEKYGYGINIVDSNFSAMLASVAGGRCDFAGSVITVTEERKKQMDFSDPNYYGSVVLVSRERSDNDAPLLSESSRLDALAGCKLGILTGSIYDQIAEQYTPKSTLLMLNSVSDLCIAMDSGIIDGYYVDQPTARITMKYYPNTSIYAVVTLSNNGIIFPKGALESDVLLSQVNQYLAEIKSNGVFSEIGRLWFGDDEEQKTVDYDALTGENGILHVATSTVVGEPFSYIKDGKLVGYDLDMIARFCKEYGYGMDVVDYDFGGMLAAVASGKADLGAACITITEERKEIMNYSEPNYYGGGVIVTKEGSFASRGETKSAFRTFVDGVAESFNKTFIREDRWKLFVGGIGTTVAITMLSVLFGTLLGFITYLGYRNNHKLFNGLIDLICDILSKTPTVLILMILFYIVFVNAKLDGFWVSVIGFSILFACTVTTLMKVSVQAVDNGQREAALALGYTETEAFLRVILPQSLRQFLPIYKGEIVALVKSTAIVGYIAVQDLTKVSDIIRSRTFEPFFALIVSTIIYILIASLLILLVDRIQISIDPKKRKAEKILKGVKTK